MVLEVGNGLLRKVIVEPLVGDLVARQIGVAIGSLMVVLVAYRPPSPGPGFTAASGFAGGVERGRAGRPIRPVQLRHGPPSRISARSS